jgi:hypothetical protein
LTFPSAPEFKAEEIHYCLCYLPAITILIFHPSGSALPKISESQLLFILNFFSCRRWRITALLKEVTDKLLRARGETLKVIKLARCQWIMFVILAPWEAEIRRIMV